MGSSASRVWVGFSDDPVADSPPGSIVVTLMSEEVAGSGAHRTTELCLDTMLDRLSPPPGRLLDVGCGSGILSIVAAKLGVPEVTAIDIDPGSVRVAREAVMLSGVGSEVSALDVAVCDLDETFPWVVANITASVLIDLAGAVAARVAPDGHLLLCGITELREDSVRSAYATVAETPGHPLSFELVERKTQGPWVSLLLRRIP